MPTYSIQAPNGRTYEIEGPAGASQEQVIQAVLAQNPEAGTPGKPQTSTADLGYSALSGVGSLVQFPAQLYGLATGDMDTSLNKMGQAISEYAKSKQSAGLKARQQAQSEAIQQSAKEGFLPEVGTAVSTTFKDPALLGNFLAENVVNLLPGFGIARGTVALGMRKVAQEVAKEGLEGEARAAALKAAQETLRKRAEAAAVGMGVTQQGAQVGGQTYEDVYKKLISEGKSPEEAASQALTLARSAGASGAVISYLSQRLPGARSLEKAFAGTPGTAGRLAGIGKGVLGEGISEAVEEGGGQLAQNAAMGVVDPNQNIMQGVGTAVGQAGLLGGIMGGAAGYHSAGVGERARAQEEEQQRAAQAQAAQVQQAQEEAARQTKLQDPAYAAEVAQAYQAAEAQYAQMKEAAKVSKDATMAEKLQAEQAQEALKTYEQETLRPAAEEYLQVKPVLDAQQAEAAKAQAETTARAAEAQPTPETGLFPNAPVPTEPDKNLLGAPVQAPTAPVQPVDIAARRDALTRAISGLTDALEQQRDKVATAARAGDTATAQQEAQQFRKIDTALKQAQKEIAQLPRTAQAAPVDDALNKQYAQTQKKLQQAGESGDVDAIERLSKKLDALKTQNPGLFTAENMAKSTAVQDAVPPLPAPIEQGPVATKTVAPTAEMAQKPVLPTTVQNTPMPQVAAKKQTMRLKKAQVQEKAPSIKREIAERVSTPLPETVKAAAKKGDARSVLQDIAARGSTPTVRSVASKLLSYAANVRMYVDDKVQYKGESVSGLYEPRTNTVTLHSEGLTEEDTLHELVHAATDAALLLPEERLSIEQRAAKRELEGLRQAVASRPEFRGEPIHNVREFAAEVLSNPNLQAKLDALGKPKTLWQRFKESVLKLLGFTSGPTQTDKARALVERLMQPSRPLTTLRNSTAASIGRSATQALAEKLISKPKTFKERMDSNLGLSFEMAAVDMRAPIMKALGAAGAKKAAQAAYLIRKADNRMGHTYAALAEGPLQAKKDAAGNTIIEAGNGPSAKEIFEAVGKLPGKDGPAKMAAAQVYLTAKRAERVGWDKLGFDPSNVAALEQQGKDMMREVNADPVMKSALEEVSKLYNEYNKGLINFLAQSGKISKAEAAKLSEHGDYVPFYRVQGSGSAELVLGEGKTLPVGNIRTQPYLQELKGGDQKLLPLNDALIRNTMLLTDMAMRNMATKDVAYALQSIGKDAKVMQIRRGDGGNSPHVVRFNQEPDPKVPGDDGARHVVIDTTGTAVEGIPSDMLAQSLEGSFAVMPAFLRVAGWFGDVLRSGVTRNPMYIARQLVRDPMAASFTGGLDAGPVTAVFKSVSEFGKQMAGTSEPAKALLKKGVVHSNIFTGDPDDMAKFGLQLATGDQSAYQKFIAGWDAAAMKADGATRAQLYADAIKKGMPEMEAELATMEMMNFNKRGISPTVQYASRMIPFFNAQIQGLNVLYKAYKGQMPLEEKLKIKQKFMNRALVLAAMTLMYSAAMDDDETYRNARARDRYGNFILPNPTGGEHIKLPIPFEVGVLFKAIPEALLDAIKGNFGKQEWDATKQMLVQQIPGSGSYGVPQLARPALEVMSNSNWYTGRTIESPQQQKLAPQERFGKTTSELAKSLSSALAQQPLEAVKLSPLQIEHLANGYLGQLPVIVARMVNSVFADADAQKTEPAARGSDTPVFGSLFQRKYGGGPADLAYAQAQALEEAANTYQKMLKEGRVAAAAEFKENATVVIASPELAKRFTTQMSAFSKAEEALRRTVKDPEALRARLDTLEQQRNDFAKMFNQAVASLAR